jgi:hypothetical protein
VPGVSETIRVRSIVGRYLEHSRIFVFGRGERERFFIGSADMMERNLDRRVEAITPVTDPRAMARLRTIIEVMLADDRRAWQLGNDDTWRRGRGDHRAADRPRHVRDADGHRGPATPWGERRPGRARAQVRRRRRCLPSPPGSTSASRPTPAGWRDVRLTDRYFDTADHALAAAGYGARLRRQEGRLTVGPQVRRGKVDGPRHIGGELEARRRRELDAGALAGRARREHRRAAVPAGRPLRRALLPAPARRERT